MILSLLFLHEDSDIAITELAFHYKCHYVEAYLIRAGCIKDHRELIPWFQFRELYPSNSGHLRPTPIFEIKSRMHCLGPGIDNRPFNIKGFVRAENCIIKWSAVDDVTGIIQLGCAPSTSARYRSNCG